jgi:hypothetical protein
MNPAKMTKDEQKVYARKHQIHRINRQEEYIKFCEATMKKQVEEIKKLNLEIYKYQAYIEIIKK